MVLLTLNRLLCKHILLSLYDLVITHEPAESDYELVIQLDHLGKYDGSEPHPYQCVVNKNSATPRQQAYGSQILTVTVKAGRVHKGTGVYSMYNCINCRIRNGRERVLCRVFHLRSFNPK